ncbi:MULTISPECIES: hypothetical protein [unclassified Arsukibacterium]|uniref:hypothetical protein n=1 Tax=unclassified Arsukibacterium TaxID=2635278 RepID=UPI0025C264DF|nr:MULTISPECIES: hypothetical protein [unclassified Arsukibacterium]MDX1537445.1 hypothetical protein [Arsukibacterium sp.]
MPEQHAESHNYLSDTEPAQIPSASEKIFIRLSFWQTILSVVGIFIAVLALYAALTESEAIRKQTSAAVWPFIQISIADYDFGQDASFTLTFTNTGVGPALIRAVKVEVDGKPMRDWAQVVTYLGGTFDENVGRNTISNRVLSPGRKIDLLSVAEPALARKFQAAVGNPQTAITFCYCSIFDDCWLADSRSQVLDPEPVDACPDFQHETFAN